jgi:hypothetical protein
MTNRNARGSKHKLAGQESALSACAPCRRVAVAVLYRSAAIFLVATALVGCSRGPTHRETELQIRGLQLYLAVLDEFKNERGEGMPVTGENQIDAIVTKSIPPGTSFQDAVAILTAAHFTVGHPESVSNPDNHGDKTERFVIKGDLKLLSVFVLGGTSAYIILDTDRPNPEPTTVKRAGGFIRSVYL